MSREREKAGEEITEKGGGAPLNIPLDRIDEDLGQPRKKFDQEDLDVMVASIKERGVLSPIAVRPGENGRYIINEGARRFRATKLAGKTTIPAFVREDFDPVDQVIENLNRSNLEPMEIANALDSLMKRGMKASEVAAKMGRSPATVTMYLSLLALPKPILEAREKGIKGTDNVTVLYELQKEFKKNPERVTEHLAEATEVTVGSLNALKKVIEGESTRPPKKGKGAVDDGKPAKDGHEGRSGKSDSGGKKTLGASGFNKIKKAVLQGTYKNRMVELCLNLEPPSTTTVVCKYCDDGEYLSVEAKEVQLIGLLLDYGA